MIHMDADMARRAFGRHVGPRRPGGIYRNGLLEYDYAVLDVAFGPDVAKATGREVCWAVISQPEGSETPRADCILWDERRDQVVADPIALAAGEQVLVLPTADGGMRTIAARNVGVPGLLAYMDAATVRSGAALWHLAHRSGWTLAEGFATVGRAEFAAITLAGLMTTWTCSRESLRAVNPNDAAAIVKIAGGRLTREGWPSEGDHNL